MTGARDRSRPAASVSPSAKRRRAVRMAAHGIPLLLLCAGACSESAAEHPRRPEELRLSPLEFSPPEAEVARLPGGIPVYLVENHDLPICDLTIQFRMGLRFLPPEEHVACEILSALWRSGGTESLAPDSLDSVLAALDASIDAWVGMRTGGVSVSFASGDLEHALPLWRDVVLHPRFDPDRLDKAKADHLRDLQAINNDPSAIASERMDRLLHGKDYPTSRYETKTEIEAVTSEQVAALHRRFVQPAEAVIGVSGDFDRRNMLALLDRIVSEWSADAIRSDSRRPSEPAGGPGSQPPTGPGPQPAAASPLAMPLWTPHPEPGVYLLRGEYEQSQVRIGRIVRGLTLDSPEYPPADILSFGFGYGRVFYKVREEGLSYGAAVFLGVHDEFSTAEGFGSCRGDVTVALLRSMLDELRRLDREPLTPDEVETARTFQIGTVIRGFQTPADVMRDQVAQVAARRPADFQARRLQGLKVSTAESVNRLAAPYLTREDSLVVLVLGDPSAFDAPLDSLGLGPGKELEPVMFGE